MAFDENEADLNDYSGGPHWLSGPGKVDRKAIYAKHRAKYLAERPRVVNPVKPETTARLSRALARAEKRGTVRLIKIWQTAIAILDRSELPLRDLIERELATTAAASRVRVGEAMRATTVVIKKVTALRTRAIKQAFLCLRSSLGDPQIEGVSLAQWAAYFVEQDVSRISAAIRVGLTSGLDSTDIARAVIGNLRLRGTDGVTEITRQNIARLGRVAIKPSKR